MVSTLREFRADPVGFLHRKASPDSPTVEFRIGRRTLILITDAELIEEVLVKRQRSFCKGPGLLRLRPVLGNGLLTADGERHAKNRRILQPAFTVNKIAEYGRDIPSIITGAIRGWQSGSTIDIQREMSRLTLQVISATVFRSQQPPNHETISSEIASNLDALYRPLVQCPHSSAKQQPSVSQVTTAIESLTKSSSPAPERDDLLSLIATSDLSESDQLDEQITFLLGGHESVATSLAWTWYALSQNPAIREKFEAEIDNTVQPFASPDELPYTRMIVAESLRLYPPAWLFSREVIERVEIGGIAYPAGSIFVVAPSVTHVDRRYWDNPFDFDPERWEMRSEPIRSRPKYAYFPFGAGARRCIGEQFALTELPLALATIGRQWRLQYPSALPEPEFDPVVTLRPRDGLPMTLIKR